MNKKINIFIIILALAIIPLIISANNGDKINKLFDENYGPYGKISLKNQTNGNSEIIVYTLDDYTTHCLTKCEASGTATINKKHKLFNKINFKDRSNKINSVDHTIYILKSENITKYRTIYEPICVGVVNGSLCIDNSVKVQEFIHTNFFWEEYDKKPLNPGTYKWKLVANKRFGQEIDWIPNVLGIDLEEWAWWNTDYRFKRGYNINNTGSSTLINFPYLVNGSAGFDVGSNPDETQYVWSIVNTLTTSNQTHYLYYTNNSYYAISNGSENTQQDMDVDFGNETDVNARALWRDAGAILVYHIEAAGGEFVEATGVLNGSYVSAPPIVPGKIGKGVEFDGSLDRIDIAETSSPAHLDIGKNFSFSFWVNRTMDDVQQALMSASQTACGDNYIFFNGSNNLRIAIQGNYINNFSAPILNNTWYHVGFTSSDANKSLYINGKWNASDTNNGGILNLTCMVEVAGNSLSFGAEETGAQPFGGVLDEFRFYNETKSGDWMLQEFNLGNHQLNNEQEFVGNVTLWEPTNSSTFSTSNVSFNCTVIGADQAQNLSNLSLILNDNINFTNTTAASNISLNLDVLNLNHGINNWTCRAVDSTGNEKNAATFSFTLNDTRVPNATINAPSGSVTTITPGINISVADNFAVSSCFYNITTQANTGVEVVSLRQITNCQNDTVPDAALSDGTSYYLFLLVNDSQGNANVTNSTFTVDLPAAPGGGGGGGGGSVTIIGASGEAFWTLETTLGAGRYDIDLVGGIKVRKGLKFENVGSESRDITLGCKDIQGELCQYVTFEEESFNLPLIQEVKLTKTYDLDLPKDFPDGEYVFNIVATDDLQLQGVISNTVKVGAFGNIRVIFIKLTAFRDIFGISVHYVFILLFLIIMIPVLSFRFINVPFFQGKGVAINIIVGFILSFFSLIFI